MGRRGYKVCDNCGQEAAVRTRVCPECGTVFVSKAQKARKAKAPAQTEAMVPPPPPDLTPAPPSLKKPTGTGCSKHPKYQMKFAPASKCKECWEAWRTKQGHPKGSPCTPVTVLRVTEAGEIKNFMDQLKEALKDSKRTGGTYSAFVHGKDDDCGKAEQVTVQIEIGLPLGGK